MSGGMQRDVNLRAYSYHGIVLPNADPKGQGRYKIHIMEMHQHLGQDVGIWCKNQVHNWRSGPSEDYMYGSYFPLQPGTKVLVKFYENDFETGYVERIISDQVINTSPKIGVGSHDSANSCRDDIYMLFKTPKYHNLFVINENTDGAMGSVANSIHLYYNYRRSTMIINEDGIHWFTMDNLGITVEKNYNTWIEKDKKHFVKGNVDDFIKGNSTQFTKGNTNSFIEGEFREFSKLQHSTISKHKITLDAPQVLINSGASKMAKRAVVNKGEDEIVIQKKIDMRIVPHVNRDDTYHGFGEVVGGVPPMPKQQGDKELNKLPKGQNDRHSQVGADQTGAEISVPPEYPKDD